jgi:hypothetical protein
MYCEQIHLTYDTENDQSALNSILEYWTRITPGILQLVSQTKVVSIIFIIHLDYLLKPNGSVKLIRIKSNID